MTQERRRVNRITLETPMDGLLNKQAVRVIDLSTTGARVEHSTPMAGRKVVDLKLDTGEETLVVSCEIVRSRLQKSAADRQSIVYSSGLRFVDPVQESRGAIRALVASMVERRSTVQPNSAGPLSVAV